MIALVRNWTDFGGIDTGPDPETGLPVGPSAVADSAFLQDFAGATGGNFADVTDSGPLPQSFPLSMPDVPIVGGTLLALVLAVLGALRLRRR